MPKRAESHDLGFDTRSGYLTLRKKVEWNWKNAVNSKARRDTRVDNLKYKRRTESWITDGRNLMLKAVFRKKGVLEQKK